MRFERVEFECFSARARALRALTCILVCLVFGSCGPLQVTYHQNNWRTGWNGLEGTLTPANVRPGGFGLIHAVTLDDQVDTEPLLLGGQTIAGATHTVAYVATEGNTVYAIDGNSGAILLHTNLGTPVATPLGCGNNGPNVGINGTPTFDAQNQSLLVIAYVQTQGGPQYQLHSLDPATLNDKAGSPVVVSASQRLSDGTTYAFNASVQRQRAALLQANGNVYAAFASFCDFDPNASRGWVLGWNASTLTPLAANQVNNRQAHSPNSFFLSSVWMSGYGLASDSSGAIYFITGNSDPSGTTYDRTLNLTESVVKLSSDLSTVLDTFTPSNWGPLDQGDTDYGSGGIMLLPDQSGATPHMAVAAGKDGRMFVLNRDGMGGLHNPDIPPNVPIGGCWCGQSYYQAPDGVGRVVSSGGDRVQQWRVSATNPPSLTLEASSPQIAATGQDPGFFTSVSSALSGANTGIIWAVGRPSGSDNLVSLYAFNATPSGLTLPLLWSGVAGTWPNTGGNSNLVPAVFAGKVYVTSYMRLAIFGLVSG